MSHSQVGESSCVEISGSLGDKAELDGRAEPHPPGHRQAGEESFGRRIGMRTAHRGGEPLGGRHPGADDGRGARAGVIAEHEALGSLADDAAPEPALHRGRHHAEDSFAIGDQGEVDGEFVPAGDEFPRAVERVDQRENGCRQAAATPGCFLGYHRHAGHEPPEAFQDDRF